MFEKGHIRSPVSPKLSIQKQQSDKRHLSEPELDHPMKSQYYLSNPFHRVTLKDNDQKKKSDTMNFLFENKKNKPDFTSSTNFLQTKQYFNRQSQQKPSFSAYHFQKQENLSNGSISIDKLNNQSQSSTVCSTFFTTLSQRSSKPKEDLKSPKLLFQISNGERIPYNQRNESKPSQYNYSFQGLGFPKISQQKKENYFLQNQNSLKANPFFKQKQTEEDAKNNFRKTSFGVTSTFEQSEREFKQADDSFYRLDGRKTAKDTKCQSYTNTNHFFNDFFKNKSHQNSSQQQQSPSQSTYFLSQQAPASSSQQKSGYHKRKLSKSETKIIFNSTMYDDEISNAPLPELKSKNVAVLNIQTQKFLLNVQGNKSSEIASLTKIMTCFVICDMINRTKFRREDPIKIPLDQNTPMIISRVAASMMGTSALLRRGDQLTLWNLLHGLMLPSGNDAAFALSENIGSIFFESSLEFKQRKIANPTIITCPPREGQKEFIRVMNLYAQRLKLVNTSFSNPHGLSNNRNKSCAKDLCIIIAEAMRNQYFSSIVRCQEYKSIITDRKKQPRIVKWENTNKLLKQSEYCLGVKTGVTPSAGPCLASCFKVQNQHFVIVLLKSPTMEMRFEETMRIMRWINEVYNLQISSDCLQYNGNRDVIIENKYIKKQAGNNYCSQNTDENIVNGEGNNDENDTFDIEDYEIDIDIDEGDEINQNNMNNNNDNQQEIDTSNNSINEIYNYGSQELLSIEDQRTEQLNEDEDLQSESISEQICYEDNSYPTTTTIINNNNNKNSYDKNSEMEDIIFFRQKQQEQKLKYQQRFWQIPPLPRLANELKISGLSNYQKEFFSNKANLKINI